jgi:hypothetical protein
MMILAVVIVISLMNMMILVRMCGMMTVLNELISVVLVVLVILMIRVWSWLPRVIRFVEDRRGEGAEVLERLALASPLRPCVIPLRIRMRPGQLPLQMLFSLGTDIIP